MPHDLQRIHDQLEERNTRMETKRTFTADEMEGMDALYVALGKRTDGGLTVLERDEIVDERRWYAIRRLVFRLDGMPDDRAWLVHYKTPATEQQDVDRWDNPVSAVLVQSVEKTIKVWEAVK